MTTTRTRERHRAVVVGAGLAGTTACLDLAARGWDVTLLESRSRLGGRAYSFTREGLEVDTGQHVVLRCYSEYLALLARMGVSSLIGLQDRMDIPVLRPGARPARLRRARTGPAPLHLLPTLAGYSLLTPAERVGAARAMLALRRVDPDDPATDRQSLGGWLRAHGQGARVREALWGLVVVPALNIDVDAASLALAARVFRTGLLEQAAAGDIGVPEATLSTLHDEAARHSLARAGVRVRTRERVSAVEVTDEGCTVRTAGGETAADAVVTAVPHDQAARLLPAHVAPRKEEWAGLGSSAIVNVHLRYDRAVTDLPFGATVGSPVQWFFDRTRTAGADDPAGGQYLVVSLSAADDLLDEPAERLVDVHRRAMADLFPGAAGARLVDGFVTREPRATFRQCAGSSALRPASATASPYVAVAGAWTATGWPDTLEGAVRSGLAATRAIGSPTTHRTERSVMVR
jgi:hydroxysqualene dehydroxylase